MNKKLNLLDTQNEDISIWELVRTIFKNWSSLVIITLLATALGSLYSFVIQTQNEVTFSFNELVIFDEWNYYPPAISRSYAEDLSEYITDETGSNCFISIYLMDTNSYDNKDEYKLYVTYAPEVGAAEADETAQLIIDWHNNMIDSEYNRLSANKELLAEFFLEEYTQAELQYVNYLNENFIEENLMSEKRIKLEVTRDFAYQQLEITTSELNDLYKESLNIDSFYLHEINISSLSVSTWKTNSIISIIAGIFISLVYIFGKKSYRIYKSKNKQ